MVAAKTTGEMKVIHKRETDWDKARAWSGRKYDKWGKMETHRGCV